MDIPRHSVMDDTMGDTRFGNGERASLQREAFCLQAVGRNAYFVFYRFKL